MAAPTSAQFKRRLLRIVEIGFLDSAAIVYVATNAAGVQMDPQTTELVTQGTSQKYRDETVNSYTITLDQQVYENAWNDAAMTKTTATGVSARYHGTGLPLTQNVEVRLTVESIALADGSIRTEHIRFPMCSIRRYDPFQSAQAEAIVPGQVVLEAQQTLADLAGASLGGTAPGDFYVIDVVGA